MEEKEDIFPKEYIESLSKKLHNVWLETQLKNGIKAKYKPVNDPKLESIDIKSFRGVRVSKASIINSAKLSKPLEQVDQMLEVKSISDEVINVKNLNLYGCKFQKKTPPQKGVYIAQNIVQEPELINPTLMEKLNGSISRRYLEELEPMCSNIEPEEFDEYKEDISAIVHNIWVKENKDWADQALLVPYSQLPEIEKEKDRDAAKAIMECVQEIKSLEKLKNIEIEIMFDELSSTSKENIKKVSSWMKEINDCQTDLLNTPHSNASDVTWNALKSNIPKKVYSQSYEAFQKTLRGKQKKAIHKPDPMAAPLDEWLAGMSMQ